MAAGVWFRKCLRLHDNIALAKAAETHDDVVPFFIIDPSFDKQKIGVNRFHFLLESLRDLDEQLRKKYKSRLLVFHGKPAKVMQDLFKGKGLGKLKVESLFYERDIEPYARARDAEVEELSRKYGVPTMSFSGHTLLDLDLVVQDSGFKPPISMSMMQKLMDKHGPVSTPLPAPKKIPKLTIKGHEVPDISSLYKEEPSQRHLMPGGEREALQRLKSNCSDKNFIANFQKPKTESTGQEGAPWEPSTTGLSPYFHFGCLSIRKAWHDFEKCSKGKKGSKPPMSLIGQLLFREMFYILGASVPNYDKDKGNSTCKKIPWTKSKKMIKAWEEGRTGYPYIDALMRQLVQTGWMHHLGRHAVACFLTRGDLWQNWTVGRDIFDKYLLDADWAVNNGNWLWLAGVAPWSSPFFQVYDPSPGPKTSLNAKHAPEFIRHFLPELEGMPDKYILTPWKAPIDVQENAGCVIGKDYPKPIVDHKKAKSRNLSKFKAALKKNKGKNKKKAPSDFKSKGKPGSSRVSFAKRPAAAVAETRQPGGDPSTSADGSTPPAEQEEEEEEEKGKQGKQAEKEASRKRRASSQSGGATKKRPAAAK